MKKLLLSTTSAVMLLTFLFSNFVTAEEQRAAISKDEICVLKHEKTCVSNETRTIEGMQVKQCWNFKTIFTCLGKETNNCAGLEENAGCKVISGSCEEESASGKCKHFSHIYQCGNRLDTSSDIKLLNSEFNVEKDEKDLSGCTDKIKNTHCNILSETCIEGEETRIINGKEIFKSCWKWNRKYNCRGNIFVDDCADLKQKGCREIKKECLDKTDEGGCAAYTSIYECDEVVAKEKVECSGTKFCIGDLCEEETRETNVDFGEVIAKLKVAEEMGKDMKSCAGDKNGDPSQCRLFAGKSHSCKVTFWGAINCCMNKKRFLQQMIGTCDNGAKDLMLKRDAGTCVFVGQKKIKEMGMKIGVKKKFCCFGSKIAKIIQEQGRAQMGRGFGSYKEPDCEGLRVDEIEKIKMDEINFTEIYGDIYKKAEESITKSASKIMDKTGAIGGDPTTRGFSSEMQENIAKARKHAVKKGYEVERE